MPIITQLLDDIVNLHSNLRLKHHSLAAFTAAIDNNVNPRLAKGQRGSSSKKNKINNNRGPGGQQPQPPDNAAASLSRRFSPDAASEQGGGPSSSGGGSASKRSPLSKQMWSRMACDAGMLAFL